MSQVTLCMVPVRVGKPKAGLEYWSGGKEATLYRAGRCG